MGLMSVIEGGEVRRRVDSSTLSQRKSCINDSVNEIINAAYVCMNWTVYNLNCQMRRETSK